MKGPLMVGVDGSPESRAALEWAIELAHATDSSVVAVHAIGLLERMGPGQLPAPAAGHQAEIRRTFEQDWCEPLRRAELPYRTEMGYGPPPEVLLEKAAELHAVLLVVGARGGGRAAVGSLGSSSARLAREAAVPVVIVPAARADGQPTGPSGSSPGRG